MLLSKGKYLRCNNTKANASLRECRHFKDESKRSSRNPEKKKKQMSRYKEENKVELEHMKT